MTPSDHTSVRASTLRAERICSGDMYVGEPSTACVVVISRSPRPCTLEMPKSSTLTHGEPSRRVVRKRLAGLRSRWTMPRAWASASASQAWRA